jgi:hypothetical protein
MKIKVGTVTLRFTHNRLNRFWKWIGQFRNKSEIFINNDWYNCSIHFDFKNPNLIKISDPMKVQDDTNLITEVLLEGVYKEFEISTLKKSIILLLLNQHRINYKYHEMRRHLKERRKSYLAFLTALVLSSIYWWINESRNNVAMKFLGDSNLIQTLFIFLTISGFISIFYPFTVDKPMDTKEVERIVKKVLDDEKIRKQIEKQASI